jgi:hypothetical protein
MDLLAIGHFVATLMMKAEMGTMELTTVLHLQLIDLEMLIVRIVLMGIIHILMFHQIPAYSLPIITQLVDGLMQMFSLILIFLTGQLFQRYSQQAGMADMKL